jgi:hypothetical protein
MTSAEARKIGLPVLVQQPGMFGKIFFVAGIVLRPKTH